MTSRINNYIRQLQQLYEGGSWNGESYLDKLKNVNEQMAFNIRQAKILIIK